jgi:amino acid transporter
VTAEDDQRAARHGELEERREERGRRPGERIVRIVRPHRDEFRRAGQGIYVATEHVLKPETPLGWLYDAVRRVLIGRPLPSEAEATERVSKKVGLAIFASDNISSSAYATEETMRVLALAGVGAGALALTMPITLAVVAVLVVVVLSYLQAIRAYPSGGGSYVVASENLGTIPGLVAAAALLTDYVLTVSVSVAAGVAALGAASPIFFEHRVIAGVIVIALLTIGNLRGIRESGNIFAAPTYVYALSLGAVLAYGLFRAATGPLPNLGHPGWFARTAEPLGAFLVLRAFASGAVGLTGTEAIANGVPAFKKPEDRNAMITLVQMGSLFGTLFVIISFLGTHMGVAPDPDEQETVLSQIVGGLVGVGPLFVLVQVSTTLILTLAANTSFNGFPRLASILARDRFMPRQFAFRGDRLAFSTGIIALAVLSSALLVKFEGSVTELIPLYTVGVFIAFTLSQAGLVRRWFRVRGRAWQLSLVINAAGALATALVAAIVSITKFEGGAWMVIVVIPLIVATLYAINRHYRDVEDMLVISTPDEALRLRVQPRVVVPVGRLDRAHIEALQIARQVSGDVTAVHVSDEPEEGRRFHARWKKLVPDFPLLMIESPYRSLLRPLLAYIDAIDKGDKRRPVMVILSEFVPRHWWEFPLHNQTALRLKLHLFFRPNTVVLDVPYMASEEDERRAR